MPSHRNPRSRDKKLKSSKADIPGHRPVGARALKSAIDTLRPWLAEARVLDLYAGSGRFGLAALKEGAASVTFVERAGRLARQIESEVPEALAEQAHVVEDDALTFLSQRTEPFDVIFIDPPFELWNESYALELARRVEPVAAPGANLLVKYPARVVAFLAFGRLTPWKTVDFGESKLLYFRSE